MKTIINQKVSYEAQAYNQFNGAPLFNEDGSELIKVIETTYAKLILDCIRKPANMQTGFVYEEIENIDAVKVAIKAEKEGKIKFEDAVFKFISERVSVMSWGVPSMEFVKFKKYIKNISDATAKQ